MERVQFQQEQMLPELKDLVEKGLFTQKEVKAIIRKRTAFETALVRRIARKGDYLRYAAYEMQLESLRRMRAKRLNLPQGPPSVSDYALVRRQFQIFERALKKFKSDVGLWIQYIQTAKREGARALVGRITARALQLHPNVPSLYVLAASHELDHLSPAAARTLLQRGLRLNVDSVELWREYVKMELGFVESIRRRWEVLGISLASQAKGKAKEANGLDENIESTPFADRPPVDTDQDAQAEADMARHEILEGAIVKSVLENAVKALPRIELFRALQELLSAYPTPPTLKHVLLDHLHNLLRQTLPFDPQAAKLLAARFLTPDLDTERVVDALSKATEELFRAALHADSRSRHGLEGAFAEFTLEWCEKPLDDNLKRYLIAALRRLVRRSPSPNPVLLATHLRASLACGAPDEAGALVALARAYTAKSLQAPAVWIARLDVERAYAGTAEVDAAWAQARATAAGSPDELEAVWTWGFGQSGTVPRHDDVPLLERLLSESMRDSALRAVHDALLVRRVRGLYGDAPGYADHERGPALTDTHGLHHSAAGPASQPGMAPAERAADVRRMARDWFPTGRVWAEVFTREDEREVLEAVYDLWRRMDGVEACTAWARWLIEHGDGARAVEVIRGARGWLGADDREEVERRWADTLRTTDLEGDVDQGE